LADSLIASEFIDPMILVAIHHSSNRMNRFIPYKDPWIVKNMGGYKPKAQLYLNQLHDVVISFVEKNYQVNNKRRALIGFSFGGLNALWAGLNTDYFSFVAGLSPSLWVADYKLITEKTTKTETLKKVWFDIGTAEWNYYVPFIKTLRETGIPEENIYYYEVPEAKHFVSDWKQRIGYPLHLFSSSFDSEIKDFVLVKECIKSKSASGKVYQRLNAIAETKSGLKYSLANRAVYTITDGTGELKSDGRFYAQTESVKINVSYKGLCKEITLNNCK